MLRFDAYVATTKEATYNQLSDLLSELSEGEEFTVKEGRGMHTFGHRLSFRDSSGSEFGQVMWGGSQSFNYIEIKGEKTPAAAERLRERFWHRVTRLDSCADFDAPTAFDDLLGACLEVKKNHRLKGSRMGDWEDFPEDGRTMYLGSPASVTRARLYEKGKQPEYRHLNRPDWVRLELQVRPEKDAKEAYNRVTPQDCWGASKWSRELASLVLMEHVDPHPAGSVYRLSERDAAIKWMCKQYGAHLTSLASDLGGWDCLGLTLMEVLEELKDTH